MFKRNRLVVLGAVLFAFVCSLSLLATEADPYSLVGHLILPEGRTGDVRKEVHNALEQLGEAALPALIEATYYGQILTCTLPATLEPGEALTLSYQARATSTPIQAGIPTQVVAATSDGTRLHVSKEMVELGRAGRSVAPPVQPGDVVVFKVTVENTSPDSLTVVIVADVLFEWLEYIPATATAAWPRGSSTPAPKIEDATWVRWDAVNVLGNLASANPQMARPAIPALAARALTDINPHPRWRSLWALGTFRSQIVAEEVVPQLRIGLTSADPRIVWNAAVALAFFGQVEAAPYLNLGLDAADVMQRWEAVYCLGMVYDEESVSLLIPMLTDVQGRETRIRQEVALTLGKIRDPRAIPALVAALEDPESAVRWRAAMSLVRFGDPSVIPAIEAALATEQDPFAIEQMQKAIADLLKVRGK
ncbi:MAG: HEAT repeat domain-containing protein [Candidatus Acetothermia bacterium]|jgi:uncharacterized repeat protein (TIGR01451 family)|nr:HEAT repeat domain-containing protein [Candidatus Acetothermia bacterium]